MATTDNPLATGDAGRGWPGSPAPEQRLGTAGRMDSRGPRTGSDNRHGPGKELIRVEHLLTHTSGLPDMLPADQVLRERHAQLPEFAEQVCCCDLLFAPGTKVSYQSMGTLMAAEIVERISQRSLREVMATEIFTPLQMTSTSLGLRNDLLPRLNEVLLPEEQLDTSYHWTMAGLGEEDRRHHLWGLGWRLGAWGNDHHQPPFLTAAPLEHSWVPTRRPDLPAPYSQQSREHHCTRL